MVRDGWRLACVLSGFLIALAVVNYELRWTVIGIVVTAVCIPWDKVLDIAASVAIKYQRLKQQQAVTADGDESSVTMLRISEERR